MAVEKQNKNGRLKLKQDLAKGSFETLYILYGEEAGDERAKAGHRD